MSYDVSIGPESFNYTSNVSALFYEHMPEGVRGIDGLTGRQASEALADGFQRIYEAVGKMWSVHDVGEPAFCAKYDAKNGWGSTVGGLLFLARIMAACQRHPRKRVSVSA